MLLVIAHHFDQSARALVARWQPHGAKLMTCRDLSTAGWRYSPGRARASRAVIGGRQFAAEEITGILTRLPAVTEDELPHISAADRSYVAAEMTAFLVAWLSEVPGIVLNRPTPTCLMGPNWRIEQWLHLAARLKLPISTPRRLLTPERDNPPEYADADEATITVVGERCFGPGVEWLAAPARRLASAAGLELLAVQFDGRGPDAAFVGAYLGVDISRPEIADALLDHFHSRASHTH